MAAAILVRIYLLQEPSNATGKLENELQNERLTNFWSVRRPSRAEHVAAVVAIATPDPTRLCVIGSFAKELLLRTTDGIAT